LPHPFLHAFIVLQYQIAYLGFSQGELFKAPFQCKKTDVLKVNIKVFNLKKKRFFKGIGPVV